VWRRAGSARKLLAHFGIEILSFTQSIGSVDIGYDGVDTDAVTMKEIEESPVRCPDPDASAQMVTEIDHVAELGDTTVALFGSSRGSAPRPGQLCPLGSQARRSHRAGDLVHQRDQRRRVRRRLPGGRASRFGLPRPDRVRGWAFSDI